MSFSTLTRRNFYLGDGTTNLFPYSFKIFNQAYLRVVRKSVLNVETILTLGVDYTVSGVGLSAGGAITLATALQTGEALVILGAQPFSQDMSIRNQDAYFPATIEDGADQSRMIDQQLAERMDRTLHISPTTQGISPKLAPMSAADKLKVIRINALGTGMEVIDLVTALGDAGAGGATGKLKSPTDGSYGGPAGNPSGVAVGDLYEDAFDKMATLFSKLTPSPPANLSAKVLVIPSSYQAFGAADGVLHTTVIDNTSPIVTTGLTPNLASGFADPDQGTLSATLDAAPAGLVTLTTGDDTGLSNGLLTIIAEFDPYLGQGFGKEGIFKAITAKIQTSALAVAQHIATMVHSTTGTASLTFFVDDPGTPTVTSSSMTPSGATAQKSGVPYYATGATLSVGFTVSGAIRSHYNSTRVVQVSAPQTGTATASPSGAPGVNANFTGISQLTVASGQYTENVTATITGYNSKGGTGTGTVSNAVRVDTIGTETRVLSSTGQYPASGYGGAYDSTASLALNKELQFIAGAFRYPPLVSYAASKPAGPDYTGLTPDSYASMRWVTFNFGSVSAASSVTFTLQSASGFTSTLQSGVVIYLKVEGVTGWLDANAAYSGVGSPSANGDGALDVGSSSALVKRVTFGSTVRTGTVYIRIGLPSGSTKYFAGVQ